MRQAQLWSMQIEKTTFVWQKVHQQKTTNRVQISSISSTSNVFYPQLGLFLHFWTVKPNLTKPQHHPSSPPSPGLLHVPWSPLSSRGPPAPLPEPPPWPASWPVKSKGNKDRLVAELLGYLVALSICWVFGLFFFDLFGGALASKRLPKLWGH